MPTVAVPIRLSRSAREFARAQAHRSGVSLDGYIDGLLMAQLRQKPKLRRWRPKSLGLAGIMEVGGSATNQAARAALARRGKNR